MINEYDIKDYAETFEFTYSNSEGGKTTKQFKAHQLEIVLLEFEQFLKGSGFYFDGRITIGDNDE